MFSQRVSQNGPVERFISNAIDAEKPTLAGTTLYRVIADPKRSPATGVFGL